MGGACSTHGEKRGAYRVWVGKTEGKGPRGRPRHKLEDNIKMDLKRFDGRHGLDWIGFISLRIVVNAVMNLLVP